MTTISLQFEPRKKYLLVINILYILGKMIKHNLLSDEEDNVKGSLAKYHPIAQVNE